VDKIALGQVFFVVFRLPLPILILSIATYSAPYSLDTEGVQIKNKLYLFPSLDVYMGREDFYLVGRFGEIES
jgi:hypothetical protein